MLAVFIPPPTTPTSAASPLKSKFLSVRGLLTVSALFFLLPIAYAEDWRQVGNDINGEAAEDFSGWSLSLSSDGSVVAIGAITNDGNGTDSGHVRVYRKISGEWTQVGSDIDGKAAEDFSGWSLSLNSDGSTLAIGAITIDGHVRVYRNLDGEWSQVGSDIDGEFADDLAGYSLSLSDNGSILAIGAPGIDNNGEFVGHVRVFKNISEEWIQLGSNINGEAEGDFSGVSVSLSADGQVVAIGTPLNDGNGMEAGHVRVYRNISEEWTQVGSDIDGEIEGDNSGTISLSSNGGVVAIGAISNDSSGTNAGHVRVYRNLDGEWSQVGSDIDGELAGDASGTSVSLSADGNVVAIGASGNNGSGVDSGHVRVFRNISGTWTQLGGDIDGQKIGDGSGVSVSLSADGSVLAIGAAANDSNGEQSGHVRLFMLDDDAPNPPDLRTPSPYVFTPLNVQPADPSFKLSPSGQMVMIGEFVFGTNESPNEIGNLGSIYRMRPDGSEYSILHIFDASDNKGWRPTSGLVAIEDVLYGSTEHGGVENKGTIFRINSDGSDFKTIHELGLSEGGRPFVSTTTENILYGLTIEGPNQTEGSIFKINPDGTAFTTLHEFQGTFAGRLPFGPLTLAGSTLFGTTLNGGIFDRGTIFRINTDGSDFRTVHEFDGENGDHPRSPLVITDESLYGVTFSSFPLIPDPDKPRYGTVYRIDLDGSNFFVLHYFSGFDGAGPDGGLLRKGKLLFGTTRSGSGPAGSNDTPNTLFKINTDGTDFETLHRFAIQDSTDSEPKEALYALGQYIFGSTQRGLSGQNGSFFRLDFFGERLGIKIHHESGIPHLDITGEPGLMVDIEWSPTLGKQSNWQRLTSIEITGDEQNLADTSLGESTTRFYRGNFDL